MLYGNINHHGNFFILTRAYGNAVSLILSCLIFRHLQNKTRSVRIIVNKTANISLTVCLFCLDCIALLRIGNLHFCTNKCCGRYCQSHRLIGRRGDTVGCAIVLGLIGCRHFGLHDNIGKIKLCTANHFSGDLIIQIQLRLLVNVLIHSTACFLQRTVRAYTYHDLAGLPDSGGLGILVIGHQLQILHRSNIPQ